LISIIDVDKKTLWAQGFWHMPQNEEYFGIKKFLLNILMRLIALAVKM
jgi:hypothetical protein